MKKYFKVITFLILILPAFLYGGQENDLKYEFIKTDSSYSFRGSFVVNADFDCLIDVVYKFENISKYTSGAKSIKLLRQGEKWYEVTYTYRKLIFFENKSIWRRALERDEGKVVFEMISSKNNVSIMPDVLSSKGYYQIKPENEGFRVEYFQECTLKPGLLKNTYINKAKKEAIKFLDLFKKYVEKMCD
ncbi:hypothetical protein H8E88_33485 [candidate division KSB1 bacterium]|nr:hypothetical protein [candidate division KSB1 bacterium]MBL7095861.1 hypothetical protein [candidate division KSB1 bacterium]